MSTRCNCGCESEAVVWSESYDYDPEAPDRRGDAFREPCCVNAALYLRQSAVALRLPYTETPIKEREDAP